MFIVTNIVHVLNGMKLWCENNKAYISIHEIIIESGRVLHGLLLSNL